MANQKRTILDDIYDGARRVMEDLQHLLNPDKQRRQAPVRVPVRIRPDEQNPPRDPYGSYRR
ncbi:MAG: hypothetical protein ACOCZH_05330 [Phototrophicaceae bacterium]